MKRFIRITAIGLLIVAMVIGTVACGKGKTSSADDKTLNIRICKQGWGDDYVRALAASFEQAYAEEGYKVNIVSSDATLQGSVVTNELLLGENNGVDIYFTAGISSTSLVNISDENDVAMVAADLTDVYNSKPIKPDKTEEDITIVEKLKDGFANYNQYNGDKEEHAGKYYTYGFQASPSGLFVNKDLLTSYGLEVPRTTNELLNCYEVIEAKSSETGVHPTAWAGYNAYAYWYFLEDVWAAQYDGVEAYNKFLSMNYSDNMDEGWKVYESQGWRKSLDVLAQVANLDYAAEKTISMDHTTAQHHFLSGEAVFMANGAWLQNEMSANYLENAKKVSMIKTPIISSLGVKLGLDGNGGSDAAKCETVLIQIIDLIDEGKTVDEIVSEVGGVTAEQITEVQKARGLYYEWGVTGSTIVNAYSSKVDIAKLFLRFIASDESAKLVYEYASCFSSFNTTQDMGYEDTDSEFLKSIYEIASADNASFIYRGTSGMRQTLNINWFNTYSEIEKVIASEKGTLLGDEIMDNELKYVQETWKERLEEYRK